MNDQMGKRGEEREGKALGLGCCWKSRDGEMAKEEQVSIAAIN